VKITKEQTDRIREIARDAQVEVVVVKARPVSTRGETGPRCIDHLPLLEQHVKGTANR
jgi:hypothetical protein